MTQFAGYGDTSVPPPFFLLSRFLLTTVPFPLPRDHCSIPVVFSPFRKVFLFLFLLLWTRGTCPPPKPPLIFHPFPVTPHRIRLLSLVVQWCRQPSLFPVFMVPTAFSLSPLYPMVGFQYPSVTVEFPISGNPPSGSYDDFVQYLRFYGAFPPFLPTNCFSCA